MRLYCEPDAPPVHLQAAPRRGLPLSRRLHAGPPPAAAASEVAGSLAQRRFTLLLAVSVGAPLVPCTRTRTQLAPPWRRPVRRGDHVATSAAIVALALVASWLPARRASHIDPTIALRSE